jgi:hypothetical protein
MMVVASLTLLLAVGPAMAQSKGDDSLVSVCRNRLESMQVDINGTRDEAKKAAAASEFAMAKQALAAGNPAECSIHADRAESAMR